MTNIKRRETREVLVGNIGVGTGKINDARNGKKSYANPVRIQSMLTSDTMATDDCVNETIGLVNAGCEIVRITAPTKKHASNLKNIIKELRQKKCNVPIVADLHFRPDAALEAAKWVEKIRINPGNYADRKNFKIREYSDAEYQNELDRIEEKFSPLVELCQQRGIAMRIGTNHGSLSDRIMNRYGDTPLGMVESALEFARIARKLNYHDFIFSMKASNPKVMISAYRLLCQKLDSAGTDWNYPIHLGVTEAGDGEDGRIKSSIGISSLLNDGIGDTIRVSLTEDSIYEIPVAQKIRDLAKPNFADFHQNYIKDNDNDFNFSRRQCQAFNLQEVNIGTTEELKVAVNPKQWQELQPKIDILGECQPEIILDENNHIALTAEEVLNQEKISEINQSKTNKLISVSPASESQESLVNLYRQLANSLDSKHGILLHYDSDMSANKNADEDTDLLQAAGWLGSLICDGIGDAIYINLKSGSKNSIMLAYNILQASGARIFRTDYVACPSCGRTLFDLQSTTAMIRQATNHLKGVRIAVMGCIVNGPGEMADADFGYVGGAPGKINLYVGKTAVKTNIPQAEAVQRLVELIKEHGKWREP